MDTEENREQIQPFYTHYISQRQSPFRELKPIRALDTMGADLNRLAIKTA